MSNGNLEEHLKTYKILQKKIDHRQKSWVENKRSLVYDVLQKLVEQYDIKGEVCIEETNNNLKAVYLDLGIKNSGISKIEAGNLLHPLPKKMRQLVYTPIYNGKITIAIKWSEITGLINADNPSIIAVLEPADLERKVIIKHLSTFFQKLSASEDKVGVNNPIGY